MSSSWVTARLEDLTADNITYGVVKPGGEGDVPFVRGGDIADGRVLLSQLRTISHEVSSSYSRTLLRGGEVLISLVGNPGEVAVAPASLAGGNLARQVGLVRLNSNVDPAYVSYYLRSPRGRSELLGSMVGSVQRVINLGDLRRIEIVVPPLRTQQAIATALGSIDEKIASNARAMEILELLGSAYIDEAFPGDRFGEPDYDSDRRLGDFLSLLETGSRPTGGLSSAVRGVVSLGAQHVQSAGICAQTDFGHVSREFASAMKRGRLMDGDVLVYKDGGRPGNFVPHISAFGYGFPVDDAVINEHAYRARASSGVSQGLLYWLLRSPWMDQEMRRRGTGVAIPGLNSTNFRDLPVPERLSVKAAALNQKLDPMLVALLRYGAENRRLAKLRDTLLPELLSGRIRVPDAQEAVA